MKIKAKDKIHGVDLIIDFSEWMVHVGGASFDIVSSDVIEIDGKHYRRFNVGHHTVICDHHSTRVIKLAFTIVESGRQSTMMDVLDLTQSENVAKCTLGYELFNMMIDGCKQSAVSMTLIAYEHCISFH